MISDKRNAILSELPSGVRLVAVSKFHPVEKIREAYDAGQRLFAESRPQEFAAKVPQLPADIEWHFIGHLQTNKLKLVLPYVSLVQSVDSLHLLEAIDRWGAENDRTVPVLLELHLGAEQTKQGFSEEELWAVLLRSGGGVASETRGRPWPREWEGPADAVSGRDEERSDEGFSETMPPQRSCNTIFSHISFRGLMGMATNTDDERVIDADFARIEGLFRRIRAEFPALKETFTELSIGMSDDWRIALRHGASMIRLGTCLFGPREY